ncbi:1-deoxyxylulose-5-phosphate synthase YajO [Baekduia alba]|uniref:aldo/keto reductase n=1 Tax=Baekduia alba TaxID=2997333 RepID=UPI0023403AA5|nr:aldo/keto reductase [Baekduia alba]WCB92958.1 1-deoxyxylulose-5-phosphate synthase YajO [Baekduia alba]
MTKLGASDLDVSTLSLGTNVFGWTVDEAASHAVLDAYVAGGGNFVDTADVYSAWIDGNGGGESETIIGTWLAKHPARRDDLVVATKVSQLPPNQGLGRDAILGAADASLRRLQTDHIDLYWAHQDDEDTPLEETLAAFGELIDAGKVRAIGASNYSAPRLAEALALADRKGLPRYVALQPHYNLVERTGYEDTLAPVVAEHDVAVVPYFGLAKGFLTGKYRPDGDAVDSPRAGAAGKYLERPDAVAILDALDAVAAAHDAPVAAVALAWLAAQPHVASPIASARTVEQLDELLPVNTLELTEAEVDQLSGATASA